jgi:hypothetical protein
MSHGGDGSPLDFSRQTFYLAASMATPVVGDPEFVFGSCQVCGKRVLTYTDFGPDDGELRRCLHCETMVSTGLQPGTSVDLEANGYAVVEARPCGGGGCSAGGCGLLQR